MKRFSLIILMFIEYLCINAQIFDDMNSPLYKGRVKLVSEFMKRFNREKFPPLVDPNSNEIDKISICQLFDSEFILRNRNINEPMAFQFVDSVLSNNIKLSYTDNNWYAKTTCFGTFKGNEVSFDMYLVVEPRENEMFKWVIADVDGTIFELNPSRISDKIMLLPNEHETDFMRLNTITSEKDDFITLYSSKTNTVNRLTVFNTLVYYGYLNIEYVLEPEYVFFQVPGYVFTVKHFERESTNAGWLISSWERVSKDEKSNLLNKVYNGKYDSLPTITNMIKKISLTETEKEKQASGMVNSFVKYLNNYVTNKNESTLDSINNYVKGRYTFIISDILSNELAKHFNSKISKSYRLDSFTGWLEKIKPQQITKIYCNNVQPFHNEFLNPKYADGYTLISCDLITEGEISVMEQVIFFIFENQIAGIKLISECF